MFWKWVSVSEPVVGAAKLAQGSSPFSFRTRQFLEDAARLTLGCPSTAEYGDQNLDGFPFSPVDMI